MNYMCDTNYIVLLLCGCNDHKISYMQAVVIEVMASTDRKGILCTKIQKLRLRVLGSRFIKDEGMD